MDVIWENVTVQEILVTFSPRLGMPAQLNGRRLLFNASENLLKSLQNPLKSLPAQHGPATPYLNAFLV